MNKENFEQNMIPEAELTPPVMTSDDDFDAELMALLGDDLFEEIVSRKPAAKRDTYKGLTYDYMEMYIQKHDDEQQSIMAEYKMLRGLSDEAKEVLAESCTYLEMREWFLAKFPAIANFHETRAK